MSSAFASLLPLGGFFQDWAHDPQAITMLAIAIVGGGFALYRFRFIPRERRRETLNAMQDSYGSSATERTAVLKGFPPLLLMGKEALEVEVARAGPVRSDLAAELSSWDSLTATAAHEINDSEAKFRALLWVVEQLAPTLQDSQRDPVGAENGLTAELKVARTLVNKLNNFSQMVELNLFPQDDVLGQLHRSIAPACKAVEPLVWSQNALGGRWGLRVPRLLLRAEHFNEVRRIHRMNQLRWRREDGTEVVIQGALYRSDFGRSTGTDRLREMSWWSRFSLHCSALAVQVRPHYGGARLRKHLKFENDLIGRLKFAYDARWSSLDMTGWDEEALEASLDRHWKAGGGLEPAGAN